VLVKTQEHKSGVAIEITPLVDMVFLLLIFFLVATTFHQTEREMHIALPVASSAEPISVSLRELIVNVDANGDVFIGGRMMSIDDVTAIVREAVAVNPEQKVTVRGDKGTAYANVVRVLDVCKANGIQQPYLDTVLEG